MPPGAPPGPSAGWATGALLAGSRRWRGTGTRTGTGHLSGRVVSSRDPAERPAENVPAQWRGPSSGSRRRAMLQEVAIQQQLQELKDSDAPYRLRPPRPEAEADPPSG